MNDGVHAVNVEEIGQKVHQHVLVGGDLLQGAAQAPQGLAHGPLFPGVAKYGFRYPWIDIRQMENEKFIMLNKGSRLRYVADKVLKTHAMDPKQIEFSSIDTIWEIVSRDFGVALASDFQYPKDLDVDIFSIGSRPVTWKFVIVTRVGGYISVPVQRMIEIVKNIYRN